LQQTGRTAGTPWRVAGGKPLVCDRQRQLLKAGRGRGEEVEERRVTAPPQHVGKAPAILAPGGEVGQERERKPGARTGQRKPRHERRVRLAPGLGFVRDQPGLAGAERLGERAQPCQRLALPLRQAEEELARRRLGKTCRRCAKLRRSLLRIVYWCPANARSDSSGGGAVT